MKKFIYSNLDSGSDGNLKAGEVFAYDNDQSLRMRANTDNGYVEFIPTFIDTRVSDWNGTNAFEVYVGNRDLEFRSYPNNTTMLKFNVQNETLNTDFTFSFGNSNKGIYFGNGDFLNKNPVKWTLIADRGLTDTAVPLPGYATVADLLSGAIEGMLVAKVGNEYVSTVIPAAAVVGYPASFPIHKAGSEVGSFTFGAATDTTFTVTVGSADNIKVFMR